MLKKPTFWLIVLLALAVLDSAYWGYARFRLERGHRTVEVAVDMTQLAQVANARGTDLDGLLARCKAAGVTSVALSELTLDELEPLGRVQILPRSALPPGLGVAEGAFADFDLFVTSRDENLLSEIGRTLARKCSGSVQMIFPKLKEARRGDMFLALRGGSDVRGAIGASFDPEQLRLARKHSFAVICRYLNYPAVTPDAIGYMAALASRKNAHLVIFSEEEVLGYQDLIGQTADAFREFGLAFGTFEFAKQRGDERLSAAMFPQVLRVHSIAENEQLKLTPDVAARRFVRAAKERGIRVCYLRFFPQLKAGAIEENLKYVEEVTKGLLAAGLPLGVATPLSPFAVPRVPRAVAGMGVVAGFVLLVHLLVGLSLLPALGLWALGSVGVAAVIWAAPGMGAKLAALGAGVVFPSLALILPGVSGWLTEGERRGGLAKASLATLLSAAGVTLVGAALSVCLLADAHFMLKLDQFAGIKLAHLLPLAFAFVCYVGGLVPVGGRSWGDRWGQVKDRFGQLAREPVRFWQAAAAVIVLGAAAVAILRTGNDPGVGVSSLELKIRDWMEMVLIARPRFKEFAIGHPAMVLAVACALRGWRSFTLPLLLVAALGQVSLFNTFCHIHTPLYLTLLRAFNGLWLGWLVGLFLAWALTLVHRDSRPSKPASPTAKAPRSKK